MRDVVGMLVLVGMLGGCGARGPQVEPLPRDQPITVVAFAVEPGGVHYRYAIDTMGLRLAEQIADNLRRTGWNAQPAQTLPADVHGPVVRGRITTVDEGSRSMRFWVGFGAGRAIVAAEGEVVRRDGTTVAPFRAERGASATMDITGGEPSGLIDDCMRAVAEDVADMIRTSQYEM